MALMESPAIIIGVKLIRLFSGGEKQQRHRIGNILPEAFSNGSVLTIIGSLVIGIVSDEKQAEGIKPLLRAIFLMGSWLSSFLTWGFLQLKGFEALARQDGFCRFLEY